MTVKDLETLFDYSYWANRQLLAVVSELTPEQFTAPVAGSYGSIRNTLVHSLSAEWGWLERCGGAARGAALKAADYPTFSSLFEQWRQVESYVRAFLATLLDEDLGRVVEFAFDNGPRRALPLGELMYHAALHGVHHRGQAALLLRELGYAPGNFDMLLYYERRFSRSFSPVQTKASEESEVRYGNTNHRAFSWLLREGSATNLESHPVYTL